MISWQTATAEQLVREAARLGADQRLLVRTGCACARVVLHLTREQDREVCTHAVETAERWTRGEATAEDCHQAAVKEARAASWAASSASWAAWAAWAASWAAFAADATWAATRAASMDEPLVHNAARSVLTREVFTTLSLRHAVLGDRPTPREVAQWEEALADGALRSTLTAWSEVYASGRDDSTVMLARLAQGARDVVAETVVVDVTW